jgi:hypothetical protein
VWSAPRPSFPRTPIELQRCFATPAALCRRRGRRGVSGRVSLDIAGRTDSAARVTDTPRPGRCRLADYADAPRVSSRSRRRRGPRSIGPGPSRCVIGWRARPETFAARPEPFAACGFSDLRAGFVLRDESSRRQRSRALHGSGRAAPEHDPGSPAPGTQPQPLEIPRSTNWARISEEPDAGTRGAGTRGRGTRDAGTRGRDSASASRVAISAPTSTSSSFAPIVATTWRSPSGRFLPWARGGADDQRHDHGASDIPRISCTPMAEADRQAAAAQPAPSAGHDISCFPGGNRTGTIGRCARRG